MSKLESELFAIFVCPFTPLEVLDLQIATGWGDTPGDEIPVNWREAEPPAGFRSHYVPEFIKVQGPRRKVRAGRKPGTTLGDRDSLLRSREEWMKARMGQ